MVGMRKTAPTPAVCVGLFQPSAIQASDCAFDSKIDGLISLETGRKMNELGRGPKIPRVLHSCGRRRRDLRRGAMGADDVSNPLAPDYANPVPEKPKPKSNADFRKVRAPSKAQRLTILLFLTNL